MDILRSLPLEHIHDHDCGCEACERLRTRIDEAIRRGVEDRRRFHAAQGTRSSNGRWYR